MLLWHEVSAHKLFELLIDANANDNDNDIDTDFDR